MKDQVQAPPMQMMNMSQIQQQQPILNQQQQQKSQGIGQSQMMNRGGGYGMWPPPGLPVDQLKFQNPMLPPPGFVSNSLSNPMGRKNNKNWKGKKGNDKRIRKDNPVIGGIGSGGVAGNVGGGYKPPTLQELQQQNRLKARRYFPKKKFNNNNNNNNSNYNRFAPYAPRNTTSFIIRAKKSGGITSLVSPCPVTPAVLPTPIFSPSREVLVDMAKEEWGVDGYGSMKGLIRLRSPGNEAEDEEDDEGGSSESDVEEHVEVERRLDHDLSRFEMIYPNSGGVEHNTHYLLENRVDDQDTHIAQLEEENLILKERLFLMEREFDDLRRRLLCLERQNHVVEDVNEEVVENESENDSESRGYGRFLDENNEEVVEENNEGSNYVEAKEESDDRNAEPKEANIVENTDDLQKNVGAKDVCMEEHVPVEEEKNDGAIEGKEDTGNVSFESKQIVEDKKEIIAEGLMNVEFRDVCMDESGAAQDVVIAENLSNDEGAGKEC